LHIAWFLGAPSLARRLAILAGIALFVVVASVVVLRAALAGSIAAIGLVSALVLSALLSRHDSGGARRVNPSHTPRQER